MLTDVVLEPLGGQEATRAVIILHGLGDNGQGIMGLGEMMRMAMPNTVFLAPNAPFPCPYVPGGYQWFSSEDWTPHIILQGAQKAAAPLNEYIDHILETRKLAPSQVALVGFSQGTMMSLYVAPRRAEALAGVLGYSGALIGGTSLAQEKKSAPPVLLIHGTSDEVVPFKAMNNALEGLKAAGIEASAMACPGLGHTVDNDGLRQGVAFLKRVLG
ncbi:MAG: alpha/beta hydrolase [Alphaproteobacteria bacterium]|nr:alpha/beta hydrolase [Alphaproteobacteria bacterium]